MLNRIPAAAAAMLSLLLLSAAAHAEDRMIAGQESGAKLMQTGLTDTVTSPGRIVHEMGEDVNNFGVPGLATGAAAGGVKAAGQAVRGAGRFAIGFMDVITRPIRESRYNRSSAGSLR